MFVSVMPIHRSDCSRFHTDISSRVSSSSSSARKLEMLQKHLDAEKGRGKELERQLKNNAVVE